METVQLKRRSALGAGAGLLALGCVLGILGGAVWALVRPAYVGQVEDSAVQVDQALSPANVEFAGYGSFALLTALAGGIVAAVAVRATREGKTAGGVAWLLWAGVVSAVAAFALYVFGNWFVALAHPLPDPEALSNGDSVTLVPPVRPGAAWAAGPFAAVLVCWITNLLAYSREG